MTTATARIEDGGAQVHNIPTSARTQNYGGPYFTKTLQAGGKTRGGVGAPAAVYATPVATSTAMARIYSLTQPALEYRSMTS